MNFAELKLEIEKLSAEEQGALAGFLNCREVMRDPAWQEAVQTSIAPHDTSAPSYTVMRANLYRLSREERSELRRDLKAIALLDDPDYMAELTRRIDECEAGKGVTAEELYERLRTRKSAA